MKRWQAPVAIMLLAAVLRIAAVLHQGTAHEPEGGESRQIALHLAAGNGFSFLGFSHFGPTSIRPPIYPALLAGLYTLFGPDTPAAHTAAIAVNVLCGVLATGLILSLTARWWIGLLFAAWPTQLYAATQLQGLALGVCLLLLALILLHRRWPVAAGLVAGAAMLTESALVLPLLVAIVAFLRHRPAEVTVTLLAVAALTLPWIYRNTLVHHRPTPITNTAGQHLFLGNGPEATGSHHLRLTDFAGRPLSRLDRLSPREYDVLKGQPEAARNAQMRDWAIEWIREHPLSYARLCAIRMAKTVWMDWDHPMAWHPAHVLPRTIGMLACLAALGMLGRHTPLMGVWLLMVTAFLAAVLFTLAQARNSVLIDVPQLLLMGAIADTWRRASAPALPGTSQAATA